MVGQLLEAGLINDFPDIYSLSREQLLSLDRIGEKSTDNLLDAIEASKKRPLTSVISGLGILHVGGETAQLLAGRFGSVTRLQQASVEDLASIPGIGPIVAAAIVTHFGNEGNQRIVDDLAAAGVALETGETADDHPALADSPRPFESNRFVVTGRLQGFTRSQAESFIKDRGGQVSSNVSSKTDYVVVGEDPGSKRDDAERLGITMLSEEQLTALAENNG